MLLRFDEAMLETWQMLVFQTIKFCLWRTLENLVQLLNTTTKKPTLTQAIQHYPCYMY